MIEIPRFNIEASSWIEGKALLGKKLALAIRANIAEKLSQESKKPGLAVLLVGEDPASQVYVKNKEKAAEKCGINSIILRKDKDTSEAEILAVINKWNNDDNIHGILVQLPVPQHINEEKVVQTIAPEKDADGFHLLNTGRLFTANAETIACTPLGICVMLQEAGVETSGKEAVVLGRSNIVGKPMAQLLMDAFNCTVTTCHSRTKNLESHIRRADILVSAMGVRDKVEGEWVKSGAIIIDVGMHRVDGKLTGDLDLEKMIEKSSYYTPVPGGVGPMTIAMLLYNTYNNFKKIEAKGE